MTRAEYLEYVQECCGFPDLQDTSDSSINPLAPGYRLLREALRDTPEVCAQLRMAHRMYSELVEAVLFPERPRSLDASVLVQLMDSMLMRSNPSLTATQVAAGQVKIVEEQNRGHGHVNPRPDGVRARCGGPGICPVCSKEDSQRRDAMG